MLRYVLRTSRCLARRDIKTISTITRQFLFRYPLNCNIYNTIYKFDWKYSSAKAEDTNEQPLENVDPIVFDQVCNETLESLCEYFEELVETAPNLKGADVTYSDGVLTVDLGASYGTYVINRQTPNKQIWLSSPVSGPKRYDLVLKNGGYWIYKHDGVTLHKLLKSELSKIVNIEVEITKCSHSLV